MNKIALPINLEKAKLTDVEIIEQALPAFLLGNAFEMINHAGNRHIPKEWLEMVNISSITPLKGLPTNRIRGIAMRMDKICKETVAGSSAAGPSEFAYGTARCILDLVKDGKITNTQSQGVLVSIRFVEEAVNFEDVADLKGAKKVAGKIRNTLNADGFYL